MDIVSHAVAGAFTGLLFGEPVLGATVAVIPDLVLVGKRRELPPAFYDVTHSLLFMVVCLVGSAFIMGPNTGLVVGWALLSHLFLDIPTHGDKWAPPLLYPFSKERSGCGTEWEFFNGTWWFGLALTATWSGACWSLSVIGFR